MPEIYIVLLVIVLIILALLFLKITLSIKSVKKTGESFKTEITLKVLGLRIDILKHIRKKEKPQKVVKEKSKQKEKPKEKKPFKEKLKTLFVNIRRGRYTYLLSKRYVCRKIKIDNLDFSVVFGLDDAAHTGVSTGVLWANIYNIYGFLDKLFLIKSHKFNVTPVFDDEVFEMDFCATAHFRILNIVAMAFAIMINYVKSGKKYN